MARKVGRGYEKVRKRMGKKKKKKKKKNPIGQPKNGTKGRKSSAKSIMIVILIMIGNNN